MGVNQLKLKQILKEIYDLCLKETIGFSQENIEIVFSSMECNNDFVFNQNGTLLSHGTRMQNPSFMITKYNLGELAGLLALESPEIPEIIFDIGMINGRLTLQMSCESRESLDDLISLRTS